MHTFEECAFFLLFDLLMFYIGTVSVCVKKVSVKIGNFEYLCAQIGVLVPERSLIYKGLVKKIPVLTIKK